MIVVGYQGIGKSTLSGINSYFIDLESSNFFNDGVRTENWHKTYSKIAKSLSDNNHDVFVSSHKIVRDELVKYSKDVVLIFPSLELKDVWLKKLYVRYCDTKLEKDNKAYLNALEKYEESINDMKNDNRFSHIEIIKDSYELYDILKEYRSIIDPLMNFSNAFFECKVIY